MNLLLRLWRTFSTRRKYQLAGLMGLMLLGGLGELVTLGAVIPFLTLLASPEKANDYPALQSAAEAFGLDPATVLLPATILFAGIALASACVRLLLTWVMNRYIHALGHDLGSRIYENLLHQPYAWHSTHNSSTSIATTNKVLIVTNFYLIPLMEAIISGFLCIVILAALLIIDASAALIAGFGFAAIYLLISVIVKRRIRANGETISRTQKTRIQTLQEGLGAIRDVIIGGSQAAYVERYRNDDYAMNIAQAENTFLTLAPRYILEGLAVALVALLALFISGRPDGFSGALPVLGALALGGQKLMPLLQTLYHGWSRAQGNSAILRDVLTLAELPVAEKSLPPPLKFHDHIQLRNLSFSYSQDGPEVLSHIDLNIPKGTRIGFIGETGSGKSTLLDIIMGLLEPTEGEILVDGVRLTSRNRRAWQVHVAHVPQSIYLSDASIRENIALGCHKNSIDDDWLREVAGQAQIADVVNSLPEGYETLVGERGVRLSGGQRQRIGIARALYKRADVLVLDEATSALDETTEQAVVDCIDNLSRNLTVMVIAHRLSTLRNCDIVVKINHGRLEQVSNQKNL